MYSSTAMRYSYHFGRRPKKLDPDPFVFMATLDKVVLASYDRHTVPAGPLFHPEVILACGVSSR